MAEVSMTDILQLSVAERIQLVEDIWDSVAAEPEEVPLSDAEHAELRRRLDDYRRNPDSAIPWEEAKKIIRGRR